MIAPLATPFFNMMETGYTHALTARFASAADLSAFLNDPALAEPTQRLQSRLSCIEHAKNGASHHNQHSSRLRAERERGCHRTRRRLSATMPVYQSVPDTLWMLHIGIGAAYGNSRVDCSICICAPSSLAIDKTFAINNKPCCVS